MKLSLALVWIVIWVVAKSNEIQPCNGLMYGCDRCVNMTSPQPHYRCVKCEQGRYLYLTSIKLEGQIQNMVLSVCVEECQDHIANSSTILVNDVLTGQCRGCGSGCKRCHPVQGCLVSGRYSSVKCYQNCTQCYGPGRDECTQCKGQMYLDGSICRYKQSSTEFNIFVTAGERGPNENGSIEHPFTDLLRALEFAYFKSNPFKLSQINIWLSTGDLFILPTLESTWNSDLLSHKYSFNYDLAGVSLHISALHCGSTIEGVKITQQHNCVGPEEKAKIFNKIGGYFRFKIGASLTMTHVVIDSIDSQVDHSDQCWKLKKRCCRFNTITMQVEGVDSARCLTPTTAPRCDMDYTIPMFSFQLSKYTRNAQNLDLNKVEILHIFYSINSIVKITNSVGIINLRNSEFHSMGGCVPIISNKDPVYIPPLQTLQSQSVQLGQHQSNISCKSKSCSQIRIIGCQIHDYFIGRPMLQEMFYSSYAHRSHLIHLSLFYGDLLIKGTNFTHNQVRVRKCQLYYNRQNAMIGTQTREQALGSIHTTSVKTTQPLVYIQLTTKSDVELIGNKFVQNSGYNGGLVYIHKSKYENPLVISFNEFTQNSGLSTTSLIWIYTQSYHQTVISDNNFTQNMRCEPIKDSTPAIINILIPNEEVKIIGGEDELAFTSNHIPFFTRSTWVHSNYYRSNFYSRGLIFFKLPYVQVFNETVVQNVNNIFKEAADLYSSFKGTLGDYEASFHSWGSTTNTNTCVYTFTSFRLTTIEHVALQNQFTIQQHSGQIRTQMLLCFDVGFRYSTVSIKSIRVYNITGINRQYLQKYTNETITQHSNFYLVSGVKLQKGHYSSFIYFTKDINGSSQTELERVIIDGFELQNVQLYQSKTMNRDNGIIINYNKCDTIVLSISNINVHNLTHQDGKLKDYIIAVDMMVVNQCILSHIDIKQISMTNELFNGCPIFLIVVKQTFGYKSAPLLTITNITGQNIRSKHSGLIYLQPIKYKQTPSEVTISISEVNAINVHSGQSTVNIGKGEHHFDISFTHCVFINNTINSNEYAPTISLQDSTSSVSKLIFRNITIKGSRCLRNEGCSSILQLNQQISTLNVSLYAINIDCQDIPMQDYVAQARNQNSRQFKFESAMHIYNYRFKMADVHISNCGLLDTGVHIQQSYGNIRQMSIVNMTSHGKGALSINTGPDKQIQIQELRTMNVKAMTASSIDLQQIQHLSLIDCKFEDGYGYQYGAFQSMKSSNHDQYITFDRVRFIGNRGRLSTAIYLHLYDSNKSLIDNCEFTNNTSDEGATIFVKISYLKIQNTTFDSNMAHYGYDGIYSTESRIDMYSSTFKNTLSINSKGGYVSIVQQSDLKIFHSKFLNGHMRIGAGVSSEGNSDIRISYCEFKNLTTSLGGTIHILNPRHTFLQGNTMMNCFNSKLTLGGSYIYTKGKGTISLQNISITENVQVINQFIYMEDISVFITNLTINGYESNEIYDSKQEYYGGGLNLVDMGAIRIDGLVIQNVQGAHKGGAISISNKQIIQNRFYFKQKVKNINISSNQAVNHGGGIYIKDIPYISFSEISIMGNKVQNGGGGGIYINSTLETKMKVVLNGTVRVQQNHAIGDGGGVAWNRYGVTTTSNGIHNNTATVYGNDLASYPTYIKSVTSSEIRQGVVIRQLVQSSGDIFTIMRFALIDQIGQIVKSDNRSTGVISVKQASSNSSINIVLKGTLQKTAVNGVFTFDDLKVIAYPGSIVIFKIQSEVIDPTLPDYDPGNLNYSEVPIRIRECKLGEAFLLTGECKRCKNTTEYLLKLQTSPGSCERCVQEYMICRGGSNIGPRPKYWRSNNISSNFYQCLYPQSCLGMRSPNWNPMGDCKKGSSMRLCAVCEKGYSHSTQFECSKCSNLLVNILRFVGVVIGSIIWITYIVRKTIQSAVQGNQRLDSIYLKILMNHVQLIYLCSTFEFNWPVNTQTFFNTQGVLANVGTQFLQQECLFQSVNIKGVSKYLIILVMHGALPLLLIMGSVVFWRLKTLKHCFNCNHGLFNKRNMATIIILMFLVHPSIVKKMFDSLNCKEVDGQLYMVDQMHLPCYKGYHFIWMLTISIPSLILWGLGIPLFSWLVLCKNRHKIHKQEVMERYGFLFDGYKKNRYFWESVIMYRKILLILISVQFKLYGATVQALIVVLVLILFLILTWKYQPFQIAKLNFLELTSIQVSLLTIYCGLIFLLHRPDIYNNPNMDIRVADNGVRLREYHYLGLFLMIVVSNSYFMLYWGFNYLREFWRQFSKIYPRVYRIIFLCNSKSRMEQKIQRDKDKEKQESLKQELQKQFDKILKACDSGDLLLDETTFEQMKEYLEVDKIKGTIGQHGKPNGRQTNKVNPIIDRSHTFNDHAIDVNEMVMGPRVELGVEQSIHKQEDGQVYDQSQQEEVSPRQECKQQSQSEIQISFDEGPSLQQLEENDEDVNVSSNRELVKDDTLNSSGAVLLPPINRQQQIQFDTSSGEGEDNEQVEIEHEHEIQEDSIKPRNDK